jgi:hypothetical protein
LSPIVSPSSGTSEIPEAYDGTDGTVVIGAPRGFSAKGSRRIVPDGIELAAGTVRLNIAARRRLLQALRDI